MLPPAVLTNTAVGLNRFMFPSKLVEPNRNTMLSPVLAVNV